MDVKKTPTEDMRTTYQSETPVIQRKIGNTTYIVTGTYKKDAKEGLMDKLWRLMKNDAN
ncbi:MAG: transposon-encoded TnpW family protein [Oscillospiraceae bacterium]|nr:transposon-encoded TnpW family protein [Oscillospiraceae bacterium]